MTGMTGVDARYERPWSADLVAHSGQEDIEAAVERVLLALDERAAFAVPATR